MVSVGAKTARESHRRPVTITQAKNHDLGVETGAKMHSSKHSGELSPASCLRPVVSGQSSPAGRQVAAAGKTPSARDI